MRANVKKVDNTNKEKGSEQLPYKIWQPQKYSTARNKQVLEDALASDKYIIQLKRDGSSYTLARDEDGSIHLYGDRVSKKDGKIIDKIENVPHIAEWAKEHMPTRSQLLIECCFGETSKDVNTIMLALPAKAIARQKEKKMEMYVFDILYWAGKALYAEDFEDRWDFFDTLNRAWYLDDGQYHYPEFYSVATCYRENKKEILAKWLADKQEGGVLKLLRSNSKTSATHQVREIGETPARPANTTFKVKQVDTVDVVIIDVELPNAAYTGKDSEAYKYRAFDGNGERVPFIQKWTEIYDDEGNFVREECVDTGEIDPKYMAISHPVNRLWYLRYANAFILGAYVGDELVKIGTVASGLDDTMRKRAVEFPDYFIGEVAEIVCMSKDPKEHSLRHPRLVRLRDDKLPKNCTMEEVFGNE